MLGWLLQFLLLKLSLTLVSHAGSSAWWRGLHISVMKRIIQELPWGWSSGRGCGVGGMEEGRKRKVLGGGRRQGKPRFYCGSLASQVFGPYHGYWYPDHITCSSSPAVAGSWGPTSCPYGIVSDLGSIHKVGSLDSESIVICMKYPVGDVKEKILSWK